VERSVQTESPLRRAEQLALRCSVQRQVPRRQTLRQSRGAMIAHQRVRQIWLPGAESPEEPSVQTESPLKRAEQWALRRSAQRLGPWRPTLRRSRGAMTPHDGVRRVGLEGPSASKESLLK
jgi:hypothetical protein